MKQLVINENRDKELYTNASVDFKLILEDTFGKEYFAQKITDRVKTFENACEVLGIDVAHKQLKVIARALNEGWEPNWDDGNQRKWYPRFSHNQPGFRLLAVDYVYAGTTVGSRLVFKSEELARYAATQFLDIYKEFHTRAK